MPSSSSQRDQSSREGSSQIWHWCIRLLRDRLKSESETVSGHLPTHLPKLAFLKINADINIYEHRIRHEILTKHSCEKLKHVLLLLLLLSVTNRWIMITLIAVFGATPPYTLVYLHSLIYIGAHTSLQAKRCHFLPDSMSC